MTEHRPLAVITGATSGIGRQLAQCLARGSDLVLVARDLGCLSELADELRVRHGAGSELLSADLSCPDGISLVEKRVGLGDVDILVNSAGAGRYGSLEELDPAETASLVNLDVLAVTALCHSALGPMVERRRGWILNVSSIAAFAPGPHAAIYHAAKAYVTSFSEAVHEEVKGLGVHVTALCPGMTPTNFQARAGSRQDSLPGWLWTDTTAVARAALASLASNQAVCVPGRLNHLLVEASRLAPRSLVRRSSGFVIDRMLRAPAC